MVQLYVAHPDSEAERPRKELRGFERITLAPGEARTVELPLKASDLSYWSTDGDHRVTEEMPVRLQVGASSEGIRQTITIDITP